MPSLGLPELVVIGMILVLVFGASRLPALGEGLGRSVRALKRAFDNDPRIDVAGGASEDAPRPSASQPDADVSDAEVVETPSEEPPR